MQNLIISHSSCAEQYGDVSSDTHAHEHAYAHAHARKPQVVILQTAHYWANT